MKRTVFCISVMCLFVSLAVFANGQKESTLVESTETQQVRTLSLLIESSTPMEGFSAVAEAAKEDLGIELAIEYRPAGGEGDNVVKTRLVSGTMDDVCSYNSGALLQPLDPEEYFLDLSGEEFVERLEGSFRDGVTVNGKVFGIPISSSQVGGWLYNKKVFSELGLSVPRTWQELMEACHVIQESGTVPIIGSYKDAWTAQLVILMDYYNILSKEPDFAERYTAGKVKFASDPLALRGWEKLADTNKYMNKDYLATTYDVALDMLATGEGAMYPMTTNALSTIAQLYPDEIDNIGIFGQPGDSVDSPSGLVVWLPGGLYIDKDSEQVDAALEFFDYYTSSKAQLLYGSKLKPVGAFAIKGVELPEDSYAAVKEMQPYFDAGRVTSALEFQSPVKGSNLMQIAVECGAGLKDPLACAQAYDRDVEKQAVQLGLEGWE